MTVLSLLKSKDQITYLYADMTIRQGLEKMKYHGFTALPVITQAGVFVGCVNEGDFLWYLIDHSLKEAEEASILQIIRQKLNPPAFVSIDFTGLLHRATEQNFIPMIDDRHIFIGIITRRDIMQYFEKVYLRNEWERNVR